MDSLPDITMEIVEEPQPDVEQSNIIEDDNDELMAELERPKTAKLSQADIFADPPVVKKVKEPKKKRVLSEEHKQKLALAREKALATRRANAALKKEEKELQKTIKNNKLKSLREQANGTVKSDPVVEPVAQPEPQPVAQPQPVVQPQPVAQQYTAIDLEEMALKAILGHEKIRKERKKVKKAEQDAAMQQQLLRQQLQQTMAEPPKPKFYSSGGKWDDFF